MNLEETRRVRDGLLLILGGVCSVCGGTENIEFHLRYELPDTSLIVATKWWPERMRFYLQQYRDGNLLMRCQRCNLELKRQLLFVF
jgi:hypothetical protein